MEIYKTEFEKLKQFVENKTNFSAIIVKGDYGKGKSFLIKEILKTVPDTVMYVQQYPGMDTPYEALASALHQQIENSNYDLQDCNKEISHREYLKEVFINICRQTPNIIVVFHDMKEFDEKLILLIKEVIQYLKIHNIICHIIMEFSTDDLSLEQLDYLQICCEVCTCEEIILNSKEYKDYVEYFRSLLAGQIMLLPQQIEKIISEAFFNPKFISRIVNYFIDVEIIYNRDGCWYCEDKMDFHLTAKLFENHICHRYEKLDETLKETLKKASITGYEINSKLLYQPIGIIKSEEILKRIERLSHLIKQTERAFEFENDTVYNLISDKINDSEKRAVHLLIAKYLYEKIENYKDTKNILPLLNLIKKHYLKANHIEEVLHIITCYINIAYEQRNYDASLSGIKEFLDFSNGKFPFVEQQLIIRRTEIYNKLGQFENACQQITSINKIFLPNGNKHWVDYLTAYCLFNNGEAEKAKEIAVNIVGQLDKKVIEDDYLLIKLDILLSGMYHHFGDIRNAYRRYEQGVMLSSKSKRFQKEYNYLLSISNMFLADELAIQKIEESIKYFETNHLLISYAKSTNNVAINYIYLGNYVAAEQYLKSSENVFNEICSTSCHYPQNNLATVYAHLGKYDEALKLFEQAKNQPIELFSILWISINIANCYRKLGNITKCEDILNEVSQNIELTKENTLLLKRNLYIAKTLLLLDKGNYFDAQENCILALDLEINKLHNDTYKIFLSKLLLQISEKANLIIPEIALQFKDSFVNSFCKNLLDNQTHWGNLLFWEM